jgi:hypothetical protein
VCPTLTDLDCNLASKSAHEAVRADIVERGAKRKARQLADGCTRIYAARKERLLGIEELEETCNLLIFEAHNVELG